MKDWDINIYRGILTGYNEAFIIDGKKKDELIAEDPKSAEIIRPLLRGRDIKRYSYDFADKYLIATFPSKNYNIDEFPAIKQFLIGFYPKLKQTGENLTAQEIKAVLNHAKTHGIPIKESSLKKSRKKTTNKWFETQDSISYWEDFSKQKIAWNRIASEKLFSLVDEGIIIQDSMHFFTGNHLKFLCAILNSKLFSWFMYLIIGDTAGGNAGNSDNIRNLTIPKPNRELEIQIERLIKSEQYREIDKVVYKLYDISEQEIAFIDAQ
ncbi:TaqI-like C-terminal specificity domain-containing protein [Weeksella virosa]|uniref:TaqI-like C-terminal specificity domain-containing protein n=1 Tax=Weeksella virosa TaxID=1014 RepID=UPI0039C84622